MKKHLKDLREKLIGLGEASHHKSYYPELQKKIAEVEESKLKILEGFNEKREFMRNILHEIKTPIHGVNSLIYLLNNTDLDNKQKTIVEDMISSLSRLENLIGEIQNLANSGVFGIDEYIPIKTNDLLENIISPILSRTCVQFRAIEVIGHEVETIVAKKNELTNALKMLCELGSEHAGNNAVSFRMVTITKTQNEIELLFDLTIDNKFIDSAQIKRFLYQAASDDQSGTSLNQPTSIVLSHGGYYKVVVGEEGTSYRFYSKFERDIPVSNLAEVLDENNHIDENKIEEILHIDENNKGKILIAEDNAINRSAMELLLEDYPYTIDIAKNGEEALTAFKKNTYALILMDIKMPVMSGEEAILEIRKFENSIGTHTPIIAMTAFAMTGDKEHFLSIGADEYLPKPFDFDDFEKLVDKYLKVETEEISETT